MAKLQRGKMTLQEALKTLEKKHGTGTVMRIGRGQQIKPAEVFKTGIYSIDNVLGGGIARGRVIEIFGSEASGKTTLALQTIVEAQKNKQKCAYIDVEQAFSLEYAKSIGVDLEQLYFSQPDSAEAAMDITKTLVQTGEFSIIVIDSVAALTPATELEGDAGKGQIAHLARFMSNSLKQLIADFAKTKCSLILINQLRMNVGITWGNPEVTPGGKALKYYASQRISLKQSTKIENTAGDKIGSMVMVRVEKNKIAAPYLKTQVPFLNGKGFDKASDLFFTGVKTGIITKDRITYYLGKTKLGVGEAKAKDTLLADETLQNELVNQLNSSVIPVVSSTTPEDIIEENNEN